MHRGLPLVVSIELVGCGSSESEFGTSVNSTILAWASEIFPVWFLDDFIRSVC